MTPYPELHSLLHNSEDARRRLAPDDGWRSASDRLRVLRPESLTRACHGSAFRCDVKRSLTNMPSRRDVLRGLAGAGFGLGIARWQATTGAKKKRKNKKKERKSKPNAFGCLDVDKGCKSAEQCCSGICQGKKANRKCVAHNTGGCTAQYDGFHTLVIGCGTGGFCFRTTGKASFCGVEGQCGACARDADCEPSHGPGAACVVADDCLSVSGVNTVCFSPAA